MPNQSDPKIAKWESDNYHVSVREEPTGNVALYWMSVYRKDGQRIHDWDVLQAIKNAIFSRAHEACELYPCEDRVVNQRHAYHLFVFKQPGRMFPFGIDKRPS